MSLTADEIIKIMERAKELGISSVKVEGLEATMAIPNIEEKTQEPAEVIDDKDLVALASPFDELTEEELMYWSTPYFDELQENKRHMAEQRQKDEATRG